MNLTSYTAGAIAAHVLRLRSYLTGPHWVRAELHREWFRVLPQSDLTRLLVSTELQLLQDHLSIYVRCAGCETDDEYHEWIAEQHDSCR